MLFHEVLPKRTEVRDFNIDLYVLISILDFATWHIDNYGYLLGLDTREIDTSGYLPFH